MEIKEKITLFESNKSYLIKGITLKTLSEEFKLKNQKYLSDYIRKNKEKTFRLYLNDLRIEHLLSEWKSDSKIKDYSFDMVANEIGFGSRSAFLKAFKEKTGKTPQELKNL